LQLLFTLANKLYIDTVFRKSLKESGIAATRFSTQPAIFNNILWYGIAETDSTYVVSDYSLFDNKNQFLNFRKVPRKRDLKPSEFKDVERLSWFSNQYYSIYKINENEYQYNDLRYPLLDIDNPNSSVFSFTLYKEKDRYTSWSIKDIRDYLNYADQQASSMGFTLDSVRVYLGVYGKEISRKKANLTTMFITPIGSKKVSKASVLPTPTALSLKTLPIPPLNDGDGGPDPYNP